MFRWKFWSAPISHARTPQGIRTRRKSLRFERLESRRLLAADLGAISGTVFGDLDNDGVFEPTAGETGIAGVAISLSGTDANGPVVRPIVTTGVDGSYRFDNLAAGDYIITQLPPLPAGVLPSAIGGSVLITITPQAAAGTHGLMIDAFEGASRTITATAPGADPVADSVIDPTALGGTRDMYVDVTSPGGYTTMSANAPFSPGVVDINPGFSTSARYVLTWDGDADANSVSPTGLGAVDLTASGTMQGISLLSGVDKSNETLTIRLYTDGANWSEATITMPNTGGAPTQEATALWSDFSAVGGSGADFTRIGAVQVEINASVNAMDGQVDRIAAIGPTVHTANLPNILASPAIDIEKATNGQDADSGTGPQVAVGGTATFTYVVRNMGNTGLGSVLVRDDNGTPGDTSDDFTPTFSGGDTNLNGLLDLTETWTYSASRIAVSGQYVNLGSVTANPVSTVGVDIAGLPDVSDQDPSRHFGVLADIDIEKAVNGEDADTPMGPMLPRDGDVTFTYVVTNTGDVALDDVTVTSEAPGPVTFTGGDDDGDGLLDVGETWTYVSTAAAQAGQQSCTAVVVANPVFDDGSDIALLADVTDNDPVHYFGVVSEIHLEKATNGEDADIATGPSVPFGSPVTFTYVITNPGNQPLSNVTLIDDAGTPADTSDDVSPIFLGGDDDGDGLLDPGEAWLYEWLATAIVGQYENRGVTTAEDIFGDIVTDDDLSHYLGIRPTTPTSIPPGTPTKRRFLASSR